MASSADGSRRRLLLVAGAIGAAVLGIGFALLWFFGGDPPEEVDLAATADAVTEGSEPTVPVEGVDGTWVVDTSQGEFTVTDSTTATFVGFRVDEVLQSVGDTTAVGRTPTVTGSVSVEGTTLTSAEIVADLTDIVSDRSRRDNAIQRALNTSTHPQASFVLSEPIDLGSGLEEGESVAVETPGELTINGISRTVQINLEAEIVGALVLVVGTTDIEFSDFDVTAPTAASVLSVEDHGVLEIQLWLTR